MIQTEQMSAAEMKRVIVATALLSALCSLALSVSAFGEVLSRDAIFGAGRHVDIRGDPLRHKSRRIRDTWAWRRFRVFVFRTFERAGLVFLYVCSLDAALLLPACACGMLSTAVLNLNNIRDIQNDALKGKRTIPVRIGLRRLSAITSH